MNTEHDLNDKIKAINLLIQEKYPELEKYLNEMPITIPTESHPEINLKILQDYYESLKTLLGKYIIEHP